MRGGAKKCSECLFDGAKKCDRWPIDDAKKCSKRAMNGTGRNTFRSELSESWLHVCEGETFVSAFASAHFGVLLEEGLRLGLKRMDIEPSGVALDFVEVEPVVEDILADEVDFVLALSIPPATHLRVGGLFRELPAEIPFEVIAGECVDVAPRERTKLLETPKLDHGLVAINKPEPESEERVLIPAQQVAGKAGAQSEKEHKNC